MSDKLIILVVLLLATLTYREAFSQQLKESNEFDIRKIEDIISPIMATMELEGNTLYISNIYGGFKAIDMKVNTTIWSINIQDTQHLVSVIPPIVHINEVICIHGKKAIAVKKESGTLLWQFQTKDYAITSAATDGNTLFVGDYEGNIVAVEFGTGKQLWKQCFKSNVMGLSINPDGNIFVLLGNGSLIALKQNGKLAWFIDKYKFIKLQDIAISNKLLFVASTDSFLRAIACESGKEIWKYRINTDRVYHGPSFDDSSVYVCTSVYSAITDTPFLVALDKLTGNLLYKINMPTNPSTAPVTLDNKLIIGDDTGYVSIYEKEEGKLLAQYSVNKPITASFTVGSNILYCATSEGIYPSSRGSYFRAQGTSSRGSYFRAQGT